MKRHTVAIAGTGLAALTAAARLTELGIKDIALYGNGFGGTPFIAAINFVLPENLYADTPQLYYKDMMQAGYGVSDPALVSRMAARSLDTYQLLCRWGVNFARNEDGSIKLRHVSGHSVPRSLCQTTHLIGVEIMNRLIPALKERGVEIHEGCRVVDLLTENGRAAGFTVSKDGELFQVYAPYVVAAWGGLGNLFGKSTYPDDVMGNTLGMAGLAGAELTDMEFIEFEPLVAIAPEGAVGEASPTAMLGEGGVLRNAEGERFLLKVRPQGEAGASKSLINREAWKQVAAGKGGPHGGVFLDLRPIGRKVLEGYPWFLNRLLAAGVDPDRDMLEIGPMAHSFSGGIRVDCSYESTIRGLYAAGEACGGIHGACRPAGNAGSQAAVSGMLCAEGIFSAAAGGDDFIPSEQPVRYREDPEVRAKYFPEIQQIGAEKLGIFRNGEALEAGISRLDEMTASGELDKDSFTRQSAAALHAILKAALWRKESRGTHNRLDYPETDPAFDGRNSHSA